MLPARVDAFGTPFGGIIAFSMLCTCSGNFIVLIVGPTNPGFYSYRFTPQYANYKLPSGVGSYVLGTAIGGDTCLIYAGLSCVSFAQPRGIISNLVGTS
jgi:hypothetical protein